MDWEGHGQQTWTVPPWEMAVKLPGKIYVDKIMTFIIMISLVPYGHGHTLMSSSKVWDVIVNQFTFSVI